MPAPRNVSKPHSRYGRRGASTGAAAALITLPGGGCDLPIPDLPFGREWSESERDRWHELWESPQATQWDESMIGTVATLVVYEGAVLSGTAAAWQAQELRYATEALGLTPRSMAQLGWRITDGATGVEDRR